MSNLRVGRPRPVAVPEQATSRSGHPDASARPLPRPVVAGGVLGVLYLSVLLATPGSATAGVLSDLSFVVFPALAASCCITGAAALPADQHRTWRWIGVAMVVWTAGGAAWCFISFTTAEVPFPSVADLGFIGYALPAGAALLLLPLARPSRLLRLEILLDSAVIATSVTFCVWALVLQPVQAMNGGGLTLERLVLVAYPVGDILTISLVLATFMRVRSAALGSWLSLLLGLLVLAATDLLYVSLVARGLYDAGAPYNVLWAVAFLLIAVAPHLGGLSTPGGRRLSVGQALVPYAAVAAVVAVAFGQAISPTTSPVLFGIGLLLFVLASARQVLVVIVKTRLADHLEEEVGRATHDLCTEREFLRALVDSLQVGVVACDRNGELTFHNRSLALLHSDPEALRSDEWARDLHSADGSTRLALDDVPLFRALAGERVDDVEVMVIPPDAPSLAFSATGRALRDESGQITGAVVAMHDITESRRQQDALRRRILRDELTALGNRTAFTEQLEARLSEDVAVAVLLCDLDDFKNINDSLGHDAGDDYLVATAKRLVRSLPPGCTPFRLGGDEFVVLVDPAVAPPLECAQAVLAAICAPAQVAGTQVQTTTSIGIALSGPGYDTVGELLKAADLAMYVAKADGKGRVSQYEEHLRGAAEDRLTLENDLRSAIGSDQLFLVYQPIVDVTTGRMRAAEALLRWNHPTRGAVSPVDFIPVAEQSGLILPLGAWVLQQACAQLLTWDAHGGEDAFRVTVNLSTRQLEHPGLLEELDACLRTGVHPSRLVLEVTETALTLDSDAAMHSMHAIRARGVHLAVDDFGTGYSSLSRLRSAPVSRIKIDRSFVSEIDGADAHVPLVEATMAMARGLGMGVIAEGVETVEQLHYLSNAGCPEVQGFLLSRPLAAEALLDCMSAPPWAQLMPPLTVDAGPADGFQRLVELAVDPRVSLDELLRPLLAQLMTATGLETTYLTRVDDAGDVQQVSFLQSATDGGLQESRAGAWSRPACELAGAEVDVAPELQLACLVVEPVTCPDGRLYGTLCGTSERSVRVNEAHHATLRLFARLVEQKIGGSHPTATTGTPAASYDLEQRRADGRSTWAALRGTLLQSAGEEDERRRRVRRFATTDRAWEAHADLVRERECDEGPADEMRVVIADDSELPRLVLGMLISTEGSMRLVGETGSAWTTLGVVGAEQPDILVLDYDLGDAEASEIIDHLRAVSPGTRVLLHSARADIHLLGQRMQVDRVVHKSADPEYLPAALRSLAR